MSDFLQPAALWGIAAGMIVGGFTTLWTVGAWRRFRQLRRLRGTGAKHAVNAPTTFQVMPRFESGEIEIRITTDDPDIPVARMAFGLAGAYDLRSLIESVADDVSARGLVEPGDPKGWAG